MFYVKNHGNRTLQTTPTTNTRTKTLIQRKEREIIHTYSYTSTTKKHHSHPCYTFRHDTPKPKLFFALDFYAFLTIHLSTEDRHGQTPLSLWTEILSTHIINLLKSLTHLNPLKARSKKGRIKIYYCFTKTNKSSTVSYHNIPIEMDESTAVRLQPSTSSLRRASSLFESLPRSLFFIFQI